MSDDVTLHHNARELLRSGRLPGYRPVRLWGGPGSGRDRCLVCGEPVRTDQLVFEAEFNGTGSLFFHVTCFAVLEFEGSRLSGRGSRRGHDAAMAEK